MSDQANSMQFRNTRPESSTRLSKTDVGHEVIAAEERDAKLSPGGVIPGTRLELVRWLGQGGMGVVFEVRHLDIERRYAAKLLHRSDSKRRARRFRDEARTISQIGSPWIVEIFDFKELPDGRLMYLMELVEGPSLLSLCTADEPVELPRLIALARQICKGLHDAHAEGFVHRDIKPDNIMLTTDPQGREHVKIVDFGLAALLEGPAEAKRAGTPAYMSPEQCLVREIDARSDIYSLGVTLYELACGRLPFVRDDDLTLFDDHVHNPPEPPSELAPARKLPSSIDELILRCLAKKPEQRFACAAELEAALIELQLELGVRTSWDALPAPKLDDEARRRRLDDGLARLRASSDLARRKRRWVALGLLAAIGLSAGGIWLAGADERAAVLAESDRQIEDIRERAQRAADAAHWVYPAPGETETAFRTLLELDAIEREAADSTRAQLSEEFASTLVSLGDAYWDRAESRGFAREFYAQALLFAPDHETARERAGLTPAALAEMHRRAAIPDFSEYELEAVEPLEVLALSDESERIEALVDMSADLDAKRPSAAASLERLIDGFAQEHPELPLRVAQARGRGDGQPGSPTPVEESDEPEAHASDGRGDTGEPRKEPRQRGDAKTLIKRAKSAYTSGRSDEAERLYHRTLALDEHNLPALIGLHHIHFDRGKYKDALAYAKQALALRPKRGDLNLFVGDSCMKVLDYSCARTHYEAARAAGDGRAEGRLELLDKRLGKEG